MFAQLSGFYAMSQYILIALFFAVLLLKVWQIHNSPYRQYERSLRKPNALLELSPEQKRQQQLQAQNEQLRDWDWRFSKATNDVELYERLLISAMADPSTTQGDMIARDQRDGAACAEPSTTQGYMRFRSRSEIVGTHEWNELTRQWDRVSSAPPKPTGSISRGIR